MRYLQNVRSDVAKHPLQKAEDMAISDPISVGIPRKLGEGKMLVFPGLAVNRRDMQVQALGCLVKFASRR